MININIDWLINNCSYFYCSLQIRSQKPYYTADPEVDSLVSFNCFKDKFLYIIIDFPVIFLLISFPLSLREGENICNEWKTEMKIVLFASFSWWQLNWNSWNKISQGFHLDPVVIGCNVEISTVWPSLINLFTNTAKQCKCHAYINMEENGQKIHQLQLQFCHLQLYFSQFIY